MFSPMSQHAVNSMENLMLRDDYWRDDREEVIPYCELYACKDCPICGDTCDGIDMEEDDE